MWKQKEDHKTVKDVVIANTNGSIDDLLNPKRDPYLKGLAEAVEKIKANKEKKFLIAADYDCDGVMAGTIMDLGLRAFGIDSSVRFPKRFSEGYGLSMKVIDELEENFVLVTVDNGITCIDQIKVAKEKGIIVILTDHHLKREDGILPDADAILDPNAVEGSEFTDYCGAGLAYRVIKELIPDNTDLLDKLLVFASIATVADVVPLLGDNRNLVRDGLKKINEGVGTEGLKVLLSKLNKEHYTEDDYGFLLGPIVNASGRLSDDGPKDVYDLLSREQTDDLFLIESERKEMEAQADRLIERNQERKAIVEQSMDLIDRFLADKHPEDQKALVICNTKFHEGIIGILAGQLSEKYHVPSIVFTASSSGFILKGSARTYGDIHLKNLLDQSSKYLEGYGGHAGAAGLSVKKENLRNFYMDLLFNLKDVPIEKDVTYYDLAIHETDIKRMLLGQETFAPFGEGNPKPVYRILDFDVSQAKEMGKKKNHLKLIGKMGTGAVGFGMASDYTSKGSPKKMELLGTLSYNYFRDKKYPQIEIMEMEKKEEFWEDELTSLLVF